MRWTGKRSAFTLIELLIVILIIGILGGITTTIMIGARNRTKTAIVNIQMTELSMALDSYKAKYGEYPPDLSDNAAVIRHCRKRWPRYGINDINRFINHIKWGSQLSASMDECKGETNFSFNFDDSKNYWDFSSNNPAYISAVVFWLGGLPDKNGIPKGFFNNPKAPLGFEANVTNPDSVYQGRDISGAQWEDSFYTFTDKNMLTQNYLPAFVINSLPVIYFKATNTTGTNTKGAYSNPNDTTLVKSYDFTGTAQSDLGVAIPYAKNAITWYEEERFQLVYPGIDGSFGVPNAVNRFSTICIPPTTENMTPEDMDNVANFVPNGGTLENLQE